MCELCKEACYVCGQQTFGVIAVYKAHMPLCVKHYSAAQVMYHDQMRSG